MTRRMKIFAAGILAAVLALPAYAGPFESLTEFAEALERFGYEPLPGQAGFLVEGGIAGVLRGESANSIEKPYVLVSAGAPAKLNAIGFFVGIGKSGAGHAGSAIPPREATPRLVSLERSLIVAYWEDQEFLGEGVLPLDEIAAHLDLSGMDRARGGGMTIRAAGSSPIWMRLIEQTNIPMGLDLEIVEAPDLESTRAASIFARSIPGLQFVGDKSADPGLGLMVPQGDYISLLAAKVSRLDDPPPFQRVERDAVADKPKSKKPYTGTIPAYTADVEGLLLEGVLEGGPAEAAGLQAGDVIVELAGSTITDVYTYAEVLDTLEIDVPIAVVFIRDDERLETTLTPQGR